MAVEAMAQIIRHILRDTLGVIVVNVPATAPMAAMITEPRATTPARASVFSPAEKSRNHIRNSGSLCSPTTLSMMIFSGHGAAMLIAVSMSIATEYDGEPTR